MGKVDWTDVFPVRGMDTSDLAPPDSAERIENMRHEEQGAWRTMRGYENLVTFAGERIIAIHHFRQHRSRRRWIVYEYHTGAGSTGSIAWVRFPDAIASGPLSVRVDIESQRVVVRGPNAGTQFLEDGNWLYYFHPENPSRRWNGEYTAPVGFTSQAGAPVVTTNESGFDFHDQLAANYGAIATLYNPTQRGVGSLGQTTTEPKNEDGNRVVPFKFGYAVTYLNDRGQESPPSPVVFVTGSNVQLIIGASATAVGLRSIRVDIPAAPAHCRGIRLWRTQDLVGNDASSGVALYLHSEFGSAADVNLVDDKQDDELGEPLLLDELGEFPQSVSVAETWRNRLWVSGDWEGPSRLRYSAAGLYEQMPAINYLDVGSRDSGQIVALKAVGASLLVLKSNGLFLVRSAGVDDFYVDKIIEGVGCAAPRVLHEIPGQGFFFLSRNGPYIISGLSDETGQNIQLNSIGKPMVRVWKRIVGKPALAAARSVNNKLDQEIWVQVPIRGDPTLKFGLVYHYDVGLWSIREADGAKASCFTYLEDKDLVVFGTTDTVNYQGVWAYTAALQGGNLPEGIFRSAWIRTDDRSTVRHHRPRYLSSGRSTTAAYLTWRYRKDRQGWTTPGGTLTTSIFEDEDAGVWGTLEWSATESWANTRPTEIRLDPYKMNGFEHQIEFAGPTLWLYGFSIGFDPDGGATKVKRFPQETQ